MKRYYFRLKNHGKCGCSHYTTWRYTDKCKSKAEVKRKFGKLNTIEITEIEQKEAICWD